MRINLISELERHYNEEQDFFVYISEDMLTNNVLIEESTIFTEEDEVQTIISVKHFNEIDACHYTMYWDNLLSPIQVYRIVKDIYEIYTENSLGGFLETINKLSVQYQSASMQSTEENKLNIMAWIKKSFNNTTVSGGSPTC